MIAEMEDALLDPPEFEERSASFVVRLRGGSVFAAEDRLWISQFGPLALDPNAKVALVFARRMGVIINEQLRRLRPLDREASRETLQDLVARGLLEGDVRGLLGVGAPEARTILEALVLRGLLQAKGERRGPPLPDGPQTRRGTLTRDLLSAPGGLGTTRGRWGRRR